MAKVIIGNAVGFITLNKKKGGTEVPPFSFQLEQILVSNTSGGWSNNPGTIPGC